MSLNMETETIVKSTLIQRVAEKCQETHSRDVDAAVRHIIDCMVHALNSGARIEIRGFGAFSLRYRIPRKAHNPRTGQRVAILGRYVVYFRAGKDFRERLNHPDAEAQRALVGEKEEIFV